MESPQAIPRKPDPQPQQQPQQQMAQQPQQMMPQQGVAPFPAGGMNVPLEEQQMHMMQQQMPQMHMMPQNPLVDVNKLHAGTFESNMEETQSMMGNGSKVVIEEYKHLYGSFPGVNLHQLQLMDKLNIRLKRVKIVLNGGTVKCEAGALHYLSGPITINVKTGGAGGLLKRAVQSKLSSEPMITPYYSGKGFVYLEPRYSHYALIRLENEMCVCDKGLYYASEESVDVSLYREESMSVLFRSAGEGKETMWKTKLTGTGWVVLEIPVPPLEIHKIRVTEDSPLRVDGHFAAVRRGNIKMSIHKATSSHHGTALSGEGHLLDFTGNGEVWVLPTAGDYPGSHSRR